VDALMDELLDWVGVGGHVSIYYGCPFTPGTTLLGEMPARVGKEDEDRLRESAVRRFVSQIGIIITRPPHEKARSIKYYCRLADRKRMSVERKYDGKYYQIHIDLTKGRNCI
jgi:hypothetical protein